jgi:hypothetical protein
MIPTKSELKTAFDEIEKHDLKLLPKEDGPYTVQLIDESNPDGPVEFLDRKGRMRMMMPQQDYYDMLKYTKENIFKSLTEEELAKVEPISEQEFNEALEQGRKDGELFLQSFGTRPGYYKS